MEKKELLDRAYHLILKTMIDTGQAPHYTEIAKQLNMPMEDGRKTLHELFSLGMAAWLFPGTDFITSFAPFNNLPTQYRITIDGKQKWFGQ
jgi:hypothetical protein